MVLHCRHKAFCTHNICIVAHESLMRQSVRVSKALVLMQASHRSRADATPDVYQAEMQQQGCQCIDWKNFLSMLKVVVCT